MKAVRTFNKYSRGTGEFICLFIYLVISIWRIGGMEMGVYANYVPVNYVELTHALNLLLSLYSLQDKH